MLIEAARGGHTSVVNLLLRQPLMKRRQQMDQASLANENRKLAMSARKHAAATSANACSTSSAATTTTTVVQQGKPLTSTLQHISPEQTFPPSESQSNNPDGTASTAGVTSSTGRVGSSTSASGTSSGHLQHLTKAKGVQKPTKHQLLQQQQQSQVVVGEEKESTAQQQHQHAVVSDASEKVMMVSTASTSRKVGQGSAATSSVEEGRDVIGTKRLKMSGGDPLLSVSNQSTLMATPTKQSLVDSDLSYLVTPPRPHYQDVPSAFSPGHYTTDSATALKNMQRLTSNANSPLKSGTAVHPDTGTSVDVPPLLHSQTHMANSTHVNCSNVTLPSTQLTPDDIIEGHMTADDIIARYWRQQQNTSEVTKRSHPTSTSCPVSESKPNGTTRESNSENGAQRRLCSGNFSTLPSPGQGVGGGYHTPHFHASNSAMGIPAADSQSLLVNSVSGDTHGGDSSGITQAPSVDSHPLSNMDLTRLIPHLEALAGSLQNPSSFESHYLAALAAQSHLIHPPISSEDNSIELPPDVRDEKLSLPPALDPSALLSAAEIAKLLPNIASSFESQSDTGELPAASSSSMGAPHSQPIYPTSLSTVRLLAQKLQEHTPNFEMGPDPGGGGGGGTAEEEEESELDVDLLQQNPVRSLPSSLLLDSKFPLDIPPPNDLIPPENVSMLTCTFYQSKLDICMYMYSCGCAFVLLLHVHLLIP